jgi:hypothetical protein
MAVSVAKTANRGKRQLAQKIRGLPIAIADRKHFTKRRIPQIRRIENRVSFSFSSSECREQIEDEEDELF